MILLNFCSPLSPHGFVNFFLILVIVIDSGDFDAQRLKTLHFGLNGPIILGLIIFIMFDGLPGVGIDQLVIFNIVICVILKAAAATSHLAHAGLGPLLPAIVGKQSDLGAISRLTLILVRGLAVVRVHRLTIGPPAVNTAIVCEMGGIRMRFGVFRDQTHLGHLHITNLVDLDVWLLVAVLLKDVLGHLLGARLAGKTLLLEVLVDVVFVFELYFLGTEVKALLLRGVVTGLPHVGATVVLRQEHGFA
jgi:hypothetical protein